MCRKEGLGADEARPVFDPAGPHGEFDISTLDQAKVLITKAYALSLLHPWYTYLESAAQAGEPVDPFSFDAHPIGMGISQAVEEWRTREHLRHHPLDQAAAQQMESLIIRYFREKRNSQFKTAYRHTRDQLTFLTTHAIPIQPILSLIPQLLLELHQQQASASIPTPAVPKIVAN